MKPGDKIFVECVIEQKIENVLGVYYEAHVDQYGHSGNMLNSVRFYLQEDFNNIKGG